MSCSCEKITTPRLTVACRRGGRPGGKKLLLLHGNASSSVFYESLMERLGGRYEMLAPDFRCFGDTDPLPVDAKRGLRDFSDDTDALVSALGWDRFAVLGWSMGGGAAMQYAIDHPEKTEALILEAPLSPFGFGGTYGEDGKKLDPPGLASGAGCANAKLVEAVLAGDRAFIGQVIDSVYVAPPFKVESALREKYIDSVLTTRIGEGQYPGNKAAAPVWPFILAGDSGVCNTMAPNWCDLSGLADIFPRPPILWIRGSADIMVSDQSLCDLAYLGQKGLIPGWPGEAACPPQPMLSQTRYVLERYRANGGRYEEVVIPGGGHGCMLDREAEFADALVKFLG